MRARLHVHGARPRVLLGIVSVVALLFGVAWTSGVSAAASTTTTASTATASSYTPASQGELDCNGFSPVQKPLREFNCTDIRGIPGKGNANSWDGRFYDNGHYIGHDEPDTAFTSSAPGSGNNVNWTITLGRDPKAAPTDVDPGHDVSHWFELTPAPWFSMALCDPNSFPQTSCTPKSDSNAPTCIGPNCTTGLGRRLGLHGDAVLPAGQPALHRQPELRRPPTGARPSPSTAWNAPLPSRAVTQTARSHSTSPSSSGTGCQPGRRHRRTRTSPRRCQTTRRC